MELHVNLGKDSYQIVIEKGLMKRAAQEIREIYSEIARCGDFG